MRFHSSDPSSSKQIKCLWPECDLQMKTHIPESRDRELRNLNNWTCVIGPERSSFIVGGDVLIEVERKERVSREGVWKQYTSDVERAYISFPR